MLIWCRAYVVDRIDHIFEPARAARMQAPHIGIEVNYTNEAKYDLILHKKRVQLKLFMSMINIYNRVIELTYLDFIKTNYFMCLFIFGKFGYKAILGF